MGLRIILTAWLLFSFTEEIFSGLTLNNKTSVILGLLDLTAFVILIRGIING